jgi:hypothetical protein
MAFTAWLKPRPFKAVSIISLYGVAEAAPFQSGLDHQFSRSSVLRGRLKEMPFQGGLYHFVVLVSLIVPLLASCKGVRLAAS